MKVLPTGIPVERFTGGDGAAFRERHGIEPGRPVALFVGRVAHCRRRVGVAPLVFHGGRFFTELAG